MNENTPKPQNPYAAPSVEVLSAPEPDDNAQFNQRGRVCNVGQGMAWIGQGWSLFTQAPLIWIVNVVIMIAIYAILSLIPLVGTFISYALYGLLSGGLMLGAHAQHSGRALEVEHTFAGFKSPHTSPLFVLGLLYMMAWIGIMVIAGILFVVVMGATGAIGAILSGNTSQLVGMIAGAGLGLLLVILIVMAITVPLMMAFWFAPALVALNGVSPINALGVSFMACLKNFLPFLIYGLVFAVLFVLGTIPILLGLLVVLPLLYTSSYAAYRDIFLSDDTI
jgi:uncharacterized membrane protein